MSSKPFGVHYTVDEWRDEAKRLFGPDPLKWQFVCPICGHVTTVVEWKNAGAPEGAMAYSCIGLWTKARREAFGGEGSGPCNFAGGGLFPLNPVKVIDEQGVIRHVFEFADPTEEDRGA